MSEDFTRELANFSARLAKVESKVADWEADINAGGRIDEAFEVQSQHLEAHIDRRIEEVDRKLEEVKRELRSEVEDVKRELRSEIAGVNAKLDIILQRLTGSISPEN